MEGDQITTDVRMEDLALASRRQHQAWLGSRAWGLCQLGKDTKTFEGCTYDQSDLVGSALGRQLQADETGDGGSGTLRGEIES